MYIVALSFVKNKGRSVSLCIILLWIFLAKLTYLFEKGHGSCISLHSNKLFEGCYRILKCRNSDCVSMMEPKSKSQTVLLWIYVLQTLTFVFYLLKCLLTWFTWMLRVIKEIGDNITFWGDVEKISTLRVWLLFRSTTIQVGGNLLRYNS